MLCLMYSKLFPRIKPFEKREHAVLGRWLFIWYHICRSALKKKKNRLNDGINLKPQGIQLWAETGSEKTVIVTIFHSVQTGQFLYVWEWLRENVRAPVLWFSLHQLFPLLLCDSRPIVCDSHPIVTPGWWGSLGRTSIPRTQFSLSDCCK